MVFILMNANDLMNDNWIGGLEFASKIAPSHAVLFVLCVALAVVLYLLYSTREKKE